jgi:hypothetical protein
LFLALRECVSIVAAYVGARRNLAIAAIKRTDFACVAAGIIGRGFDTPFGRTENGFDKETSTQESTQITQRRRKATDYTESKVFWPRRGEDFEALPRAAH